MEIKFDFSLRKIETPHHPYDEEFFPDESAVIQEAPSIVTGINLTILVDWDDVSRPQTGSMKRNRAPRVSFSSPDAQAFPMPPGSSHTTSAEKVNCGVNPTRETPKASGGGTGVHPDIQFNSNDTTVSSKNYRGTTDSISSDEYEDNSFSSYGNDEYSYKKNENYSHAYDDDEVSIADGSSTIATRTYHCFDSTSMKSRDTTINSKKSMKSSQSISYHSKATDRTYKTAVYFDQIPEDDELPIDATDKLQMDLHHLQLKSSADLYIDPSTIHASNQIQPRYLPSSSTTSTKLYPLQPASSIFWPSSSTTPPSSIPHHGSVAGAETSGTSKRSSSSEHSRKYKSGELLIGNDDARSERSQIARYVGTQSSDSRKSSISKSSRQKSRKTTRTSDSNLGSGVPPPSSISVRCSTIHPRVLERPKDESISKLYPQHRSDATECTKQKEMTSIKSYGTSTLIHKVEELLDDASSMMRGVDAQFAAADNGDEKGKKKVQEFSGDKTHDRKTRSSTVPVAGPTTRSSSRAKQPKRP